MRLSVVIATAVSLLCLDGINGYLPTNRNSRCRSVTNLRPFALSYATTSSLLGSSSSGGDEETDDGDSLLDESLRQNGMGLGKSSAMDVTSPQFALLQRQIAATALIGLLWIAPPLMTLSTPPMALAAPFETTTTVVEVPTEKKNLDDARATLSAATKRATQLNTDLELATVDLGTATRAAAKAEQTAEKYLKAVDAEVDKLSQVKKTGDRDIILAQKDRVAAAKEQLSVAQEVLRDAKKTEGINRAKVDSLTSSLKQTQNIKEQSKKDIAQYEKSYKQYLEKEKKLKEKQTKERQEAIRKANEQAKKKAEEEKRKEKERIEKERKQAEKEKEQRIKQNKARQEAAKKKAEQDRKKEAEAKKKAEIESQKEREQQIIDKRKAEEQRLKQLEAEKQAKIKAEEAAKKAAEERKKKAAALKVKIATLEEQKGDLIVNDAPESKIKVVDQKIAAAKDELKSLISKK
ncbi:hypothetical protein ACA910_001650 [Epithemia clementina (nom. ined.)]